MSVFIMQAGEQDASVGEYPDFTGRGFKARGKGFDHAALIAKGQIGRAIGKHPCQAESATGGDADLSCDQHPPVRIEGDVLGQAGHTAREIHLSDAGSGKCSVELTGSTQ
ncbi:hypothetical protein D3C81_1944270 [compost metagenome]